MRSDSAARRERSRLPGGVWLTAGAVLAVQLVMSARYGYHRDELYFLAAGRRLAWGYVDQPPLTPLLARLADELAGGRLLLLRLWPALAICAVIVLAAVIARDLGGGRSAQRLSAIATAASTLLLAVGHLLSTATFDLLIWVVILMLATRLLLGADPRWWLAVGAVAGVGLLNKHLVGLLAVALAIGLVAGRRSRLLASPWPWAGAGIAVLAALPNLAWQAAQGWPQLEMAASLSAEVGGAGGRALQLVALAVTLNLALAPLWIAGLRRLAADDRLRPLAWTWVAAVVLMLATGGKFYYVAPIHVLLFAAGARAWEERGSARGLRRAGAMFAFWGVLFAPIALPLLPVGALQTVPVHKANEELGETIGWPELVAAVADAVDSLSAQERAQAAIYTGNYGEAGALEHLGRDLDLPPIVSGHNSYWLWGPPPDDTAVVVAVGLGEELLQTLFEDVELVTRFQAPHGIDNGENGASIRICRGPRAEWSALWPSTRHYR